MKKSSEVLTLKEANVVISCLESAGHKIKVTKVAKDGFIVKAMEEEMDEDMEMDSGMDMEGGEEVEECNSEDEEDMDDGDEIMEGCLNGREAMIKATAYNECGVTALVTKVGKDSYVVKAEKYPGGTDTYKDKEGDTFDKKTEGKDVMEGGDKKVGPQDSLTMKDFKEDSNPHYPNVKAGAKHAVNAEEGDDEIEDDVQEEEEMTESQVRAECRRLGVAY